MGAERFNRRITERKLLLTVNRLRDGVHSTFSDWRLFHSFPQNTHPCSEEANLPLSLVFRILNHHHKNYQWCPFMQKPLWIIKMEMCRNAVTQIRSNMIFLSVCWDYLLWSNSLIVGIIPFPSLAQLRGQAPGFCTLK